MSLSNRSNDIKKQGINSILIKTNRYSNIYPTAPRRVFFPLCDGLNTVCLTFYVTYPIQGILATFSHDLMRGTVHTYFPVCVLCVQVHHWWDAGGSIWSCTTTLSLSLTHSLTSSPSISHSLASSSSLSHSFCFFLLSLPLLFISLSLSYLYDYFSLFTLLSIFLAIM